MTDVSVRTFKEFDDMGLPENLLRGVYGYGFEKPSDIQSKGIVPLMQGHDVLAQAQSGTGKTGTFCIGTIARIDPALKKPQVLILAPVRELAEQIYDVAQHIGQHLPITAYCATGGTPVHQDIRALERGVHFIVGTPGRIYDLMNRGALQRSHIKALIMDEADEMLEDRFRQQVMCILKMGFPKDTRVGLFSATMPEEIREFVGELLQDPVRILIPPEEVTLEGIKQYYAEMPKEEWKYDALCDIYQHLNIGQAIIYCNKRQKAEWLTEKMVNQGFPVTFIHGEMEVAERRRRMMEFRLGRTRVIITTDLLSRGIDVQAISLVINYELPIQRESYIHRIGRSGRYGRKGVAINLVLPDEVRAMKEIEHHYGTHVAELPEDLASIAV